MTKTQSYISFKGSVHAICLWWLVSIGISAVVYVLHYVLSQFLRFWARKREKERFARELQKKNKIDQSPEEPIDFDDVLEAIEDLNKEAHPSRRKISLEFEVDSKNKYNPSLNKVVAFDNKSSNSQVSIQMAEEEEEEKKDGKIQIQQNGD